MQDLTGKWIFKLRNRTIFVTVAVLLATILAITFVLRDQLIKDSESMTRELSNAIRLSLKSQMLGGASTAVIQDTIANIVGDRGSVSRIMILGINGTVVFSSDVELVGSSMNGICTDCHSTPGSIPSESTFVLKEADDSIHRNVAVIRNDAGCNDCHAEAPVLGKLVIDRSLKDTYSLLKSVEGMMFGSAVLLIGFMAPFLTRRVGKYIREISKQNQELSLLQNMIERLSNTIDRSELVVICTGIMKDLFAADEIVFVIPTIDDRYVVKIWSRETDRLKRSKGDISEPPQPIIERWTEGNLTEPLVSHDSRKAYLPINKNDTRLALITVYRKDKPLNDFGLKLINTITAQSAVAFENARLYYMAITDEMTQLFTQRHFRHCICREHLKAEEKGDKLTMLMMDLDNFKMINDTYGHQCGDAVLKGVADSIHSAIRDDDHAFRYGGEEFVVLFSNTDAEHGSLLAERVRRVIEHTVIRTDSVELKVTISIGVATYPDNADDVTDLIAKADEALYVAKRTGKNKVVVNSQTLIESI